ncbi:peptidase S16 [Psychrobacter sp. FDAARGOS_221]|nr:peptidase S16 [Psychrobacter sp. FDAARGOS_221]
MKIDSSNKKAKNKLRNQQAVTAVINACKVSPEQLKKYTDRSSLPKTTESAPKLNLSFGQDRAVHALQTACAIKATGYHVFAAGEHGLGKRTFIQHYLHQHGEPQTDLVDWIYVYNFRQPSQPIAIVLASGNASDLANRIQVIWQQLLEHLSHARHELHEAHSAVLAGLTSVLKAAHADDKDHYQQQYKQLMQIAENYLQPLFEKLKQNFEVNPELADYLVLLQQDMIVESVHTLLAHSGQPETMTHSLPNKYQLHIMTAHQQSSASLKSADSSSQRHSPKSISSQGAPIVFEPNPSVENLFGRADAHYLTHTSGAPNSSVNANIALNIQPGALHRANGGYLLIEAHQLNDCPDAWRALKLALRANQIDFSHAQQNRMLQPGTSLYPVSLSPSPIPLSVKVILLGDPDLYDQFADHDVDFTSLFKIRADFHQEVTRSSENERQMSAKFADIINKYQIHHFDRDAQAVVLEFLSRQSEDQNKLSLHADSLIQLMLEASRHADLAQKNLVSAQHVKQALSDISYRSGYLKELYLQEITDGQQLINTTGTAVGQINALTIIDYANSEFGMPALLTAVVQNSVGSGDILDIERDVELGGSLHAKGMLIMNSYLRALFSPYYPLNFTASLAFEQSYAHIDGDSATLAEACALLSALADAPISQELGITGSMNQLGRVQAVGGVNTKVAGFFDACSHQGLTGNQGVILPYANISQLMLRDDIIAAVKAGQFHIYGVKTLSDALTILANTQVDSKNKKGRYRSSSLFGKIIKNLQKWEEQLNPPEELEEPVSTKENTPDTDDATNN